MVQNILEVKNLTKNFSGFTAVDHISLSIKEGEIVGLLGPNGAGKTTTIQMLLGLITPTTGSIKYFGQEFSSHRESILSRINFSSAYSHVQGRLTVVQNLTIYAGLYGIADQKKRINELLELMEISEFANQLVWKLSSGQQTRVNLGKALLNRPRLLLMDEPTASLDPEIANKTIELVQHLQKKERVAILYTSHDMEEVEKICDRVIFLNHGKIVAEDTPLGLTKRVGDSRLIITFDGDQKPLRSYLELNKTVFHIPRAHVVEIELSDKDIPKTLFGLSKEGVWMTEIDVQKPNLEDFFLTLARGNYELTTH